MLSSLLLHIWVKQSYHTVPQEHLPFISALQFCLCWGRQKSYFNEVIPNTGHNPE